MSGASYHVPSMAEISVVPWNGLKVVSTFSGAGGSCTGYRMAGYRVVWANELVPIAAEAYRANHNSYLDTRDIRQVKPQEILQQIGLEAGDVDLLDGSPPCASFSISGARARNWDKENSYSEIRQRVDDLFYEYIRLLRGLQPKTFVAENVDGLIKGVSKGYFKDILRNLRASGYCVEARVLDAQWLGVPQARRRLIFVGVRSDLQRLPVFPAPLAHRYSLYDALASLVAPVEPETSISRYKIGALWNTLKPGEGHAKRFNLVRASWLKPCPTLTAGAGRGGTASISHPDEQRKFSIAELKRICAFPDDYVLVGSYEQQAERLGRAVPPVMMAAIATSLKGVLHANTT